MEALQLHARDKLEQMFAYAYRSRCRRSAILNYFGDRSAVENCHCDVCRGTVFARPEGLRLSPSRGESRSTERATQASGSAAGERPFDAPAEERFERLKTARRHLADTQKWPAFCVAHDSVLRDVARAAPQTLEALAQIKGIGAQKLEKFGNAFLEAVKGP